MANRTQRRSRRSRRPWWRWRPPLWAVVVLVGVAVVATWLLLRPSPVDELRAQSAATDREVGAQVVDRALDVVGTVQGLLDETHDALPGDDGSTEPVVAPATAEQVAQWREGVEGVRADLVVDGSAGTSVNVARNALADATDQVALVVDLYDQALGLPPDQRDSLLSTIGAARRGAVDTWNTAAIQVDVISIDLGRGHSHVYVSGTPGEPPPDHGGG